MAQKEQEDSGDGLEEYRPATGTIESDTEVRTNEHPLDDYLDEDEDMSFESDSRVTGERFAFRYKDALAYVREYIANSQSACIRRARYELRQHDSDTYDEEWFDTHTLRDSLEEAETVTGYRALIEVHVSPPDTDLDRVVVEDNGIGITLEELTAMKQLGLSANHQDGTISGNFGQGIVSVFPAVSKYGEVNFWTRDRRTGVSYGEKMLINQFKNIDGKRDEFGTEWHIPAHGEESKGADVLSAVEKHSENLYVPLFSYEYDTDGTVVDQQEYTFSPLTDSVSDDKATVTYEDEFIEAVASPAIDPVGDADVQRLLISFPIKADDTQTRVGSWGISYRLKKENGPVWLCSHDDCDHTGLIPIESLGYDRLTEEEQSRHVSRRELNPVSEETTPTHTFLEDEADVVLPEPVDDRDRLRDYDGEMAEVLKHKLMGVAFERAMSSLEAFGQSGDGFDAIYDISPSEAEIIKMVYQNSLGSKMRVLETKADERGLKFDHGTKEAFIESMNQVSVVDRGASNPTYTSNHTSRDIFDICAGQSSGDVFMAVSPSEDKCKLAWEIDDENEVVIIDGAEDYDSYADMFGWTPLKDLSLRDIEEKYDVNTAVANRLGRGTTSKQSGGSWDGDLDAPSRVIKVRKKRDGTNDSSMMSLNAGEVEDAVADDSDFYMNHLLVIPETEVTSPRFGAQYSQGAVYRTIVPNYVCEYLKGTDGVTVVDPNDIESSVKEIRESMNDENVVSIDISNTTHFGEDQDTVVDELAIEHVSPDTAESGDTVAVISPEMRDKIEDDAGGVVDITEKFASLIDALDETDTLDHDTDRILFPSSDQLHKTMYAWNHSESDFEFTDASIPDWVIISNPQSGCPFYTDEEPSITGAIIEIVLPRSIFDRGTPTWKALVGSNKYKIRRMSTDGKAVIETMYELARQDDDVVYPYQR